ncbi:MAG: mechanosensitive ion channel family protein [Deltaproteobacteria bacterium]|nr:mechanosensitive ion channel family protein [Deltaproteobacteria bacterium]
MQTRGLVAAAILCVTLAAPGGSSATPTPPDPARPADAPALDRASPRAAVQGFLAATDRGDGARAALFLDLAAVPAARRAAAASELRAVLDRQVWIDVATLSDAPEGRGDDGLEANRDGLGWLDTPSGPHQVQLTRVDRDGALRWVFAAASVAAALRVYDAYGYGDHPAFLPAALVEYRLLHVQLWQWMALLLLALGAYLLAALATRLLRTLLRPIARRTRTALDDRLLQLGAGPAHLLIAVALFSAGHRPLGLTAAARTVLAGGEYLLALAAVTWLVLRLVDLAGDALRERLARRGQSEAISLVAPGRRTAQACVLGLGGIALLDGLGFNVTALLAGLGVGGIAVALAAQKSLENLFGGITLYADRPVRVGDFCRFGDMVGTVEDIGLRSTRIRTLERCVVSVPNAEFANLQLENFTRRDKFWYHPTIGLRYDTTPDQLRYVLVEVRRMLYAHPKVDPVPARIRFTGFGASSLDLEVFAYVLGADFDEFLAVAEDLNLRIMGIVEAAGSGFAFPSRTIYVEAGSGVDGERRRRAESEVAGWREREALYLPGFPPDKIRELRGTLAYPPSGSPGHAAADGAAARGEADR